jgi:hypothetical protein
VECPEFRELLVFACPDINDSDLAKRDKIHDMIVDASVDYIEVLKKQLGVSTFQFLKSFTLFTDIYLVVIGQNQFHSGYVVKKGSPAILCYYSTLDTSNETHNIVTTLH